MHDPESVCAVYLGLQRLEGRFSIPRFGNQVVLGAGHCPASGVGRVAPRFCSRRASGAKCARHHISADFLTGEVAVDTSKVPFYTRRGKLKVV